MKKVIFLCLLSLTLCLSKPSEPVPTPNSPPVNNTPEQTTAAPNKNQSASTQTATETKPVTVPTTTTTGGQPTQKEEPKSTSTAVPDNNTGKDAVPAKGNEEKKTETPGTPNNTPDVKPTANNETTGQDKKDDKQDDKKVTTTVAPATSPSAPTEAAKTEAPKTEAPAKADEDKHMVQARGFDGPSFMGGIILTLGLLAIGFMGFKYYKNQTERNYHTL